MSKAIAILMTAVTIILASVAISIDVYAQNTTITQHEIVNLTNTTNTTITVGNADDTNIRTQCKHYY